MSRQAIEALNKRLQSETLRSVAESTGINCGQLSAVLSGKRPASNKVLAALGLTLRAVPVQPCATCGHVHVLRWCPQEHGEPRMPAHHRPMRTWKVDGFEMRAKSPADAVKKLIAQDSIVRTSATVEDDQGRGALYAVEQVTTVRCKRVKSKETTE